MKTKYIQRLSVIFVFPLLFIACMEETFPQDGTATGNQVAESEEAVKAMSNSLINFFLETDAYGNSSNFEIGYSGYALMREVMCSDMHIANSSYDYFSTPATTIGIGPDYSWSVLTWSYYHKFLKRANDIIRLIEPENSQESMLGYLGNAHTLRAFLYMDMVRMYEYKKTGVESLDSEAEANNVYGLAVPIITPGLPESEARKNPRQPFYAVYELIYNDLELAESLLTNSKRSAKNLPDISVVNGLKARFWLELASRFTKYPNDLSTTVSNTSLVINSKEECYAKAAEYARKAISESGATPLSETDWYGGKSYSEGFNKINTSAWMWGTIMVPENLWQGWRSFNGNMSAEQTYGVGGITYGAYRIVDKNLFEAIPEADWRKSTWIAPVDAGAAPNGKYKTVLSDANFKKLPAHTSLKFKPANGNISVETEGAVTDYPLMRVEEMYFIEAEALAGSQGLQSGITALENFMNTYRYDTSIASYSCNATSIKEFQNQLMIQKRIEFWGEGVIYWDYKRLELQVERGYTGTNAHASYRFNSIEGYCAPWFNVCFSRYEVQHNPVIIQNPDPSLAIAEWRE